MTKKLLLGAIPLLIGGVIIGVNSNDKDLLRENDLTQNKSNTLAIYLENDSGEFELSNTNAFPKEGYVLDSEQTTCKNGSIVTQDPETKRISAKIVSSDTCNLYFKKEASSNVTTLLEKANAASVTDYNSGNKGEMFTFTHPEATQTTGWTEEERTDYRYIGNTPNNYIDFNNETWRVLGVFTVENESGTKEQRIKIIRNEFIGNMPWDSGYTNKWPTSSLSTLLNSGSYYNRTGSYSTNGLTATAKNQISPVKWYLGGSSTWVNLGASNYYAFEKGETVNDERNKNTLKNIGLMYPSDYIFTYALGVDEKCYTNGLECRSDKGGTPSAGWLFNPTTVQWAISPSTTNSNSAFYVGGAGDISVSNVDSTFGVRPALYLNPDVKIISGDGTAGNHYKLSES